MHATAPSMHTLCCATCREPGKAMPAHARGCAPELRGGDAGAGRVGVAGEDEHALVGLGRAVQELVRGPERVPQLLRALLRTARVRVQPAVCARTRGWLQPRARGRDRAGPKAALSALHQAAGLCLPSGAKWPDVAWRTNQVAEGLDAQCGRLVQVLEDHHIVKAERILGLALRAYAPSYVSSHAAFAGFPCRPSKGSRKLQRKQRGSQASQTSKGARSGT